LTWIVIGEGKEDENESKSMKANPAEASAVV
jgi:hypothetical protein